MNVKEFESKLFAVYKPKGIYSTKYLNIIKKLLDLKIIQFSFLSIISFIIIII